MGSGAMKAQSNIWFQARMNASEYDERLKSRESASKVLGMSTTAISDAELGLSKVMPVDKAVRMADCYNAPYLLNHYCLNECPIGCRHPISEDVVSIDRVTIKLLKNLNEEELSQLKDKLLSVAADGKINKEDEPVLIDISAQLEELSKTISELKILADTVLGRNKKQNEVSKQ